MDPKPYMQRCLDLAKLGLSKAAPNPSVGAVLVHDKEIIGEGFTSPYGGSHAEVNCINSVVASNKSKISKSTLFVSLEPCSHQGLTPPCSNLIIENNIPEVFVACLDPNPLVAGDGIKLLENANVKVQQNVLKKEAMKLNKRFFTFHVKKRPYIILKWAQTKNGFFAPNNGEQFWITSKKTKSLVHSWRSEEMGILVGENTILADNPRLNTRLVAGKNPIRIILNTSSRLDENLNIFTDGTRTIVFNFKKDLVKEAVEYIKLTKDSNTLNQVLDHLYHLKINSIFIEGGAYTLNEFIKNNLWDEAKVLTGEGELEQGMKAPEISGHLQENYSIGKDEIKIIRNEK